MGAAAGAVNIGSLFIDIGADTRGLVVAGAAMDRLGSRASRLGGRLTTALTLPLLAIGGLAAKSAIDFETSFTGIRKTVNATEAEFAQLSKEIRGIARVKPIGVNELNAVGEAAGQLGIKTKNISGFIEVMADLGETTNLSANEAATALARFDNITGGTQANFERLGSAIVALGNDSATFENEIVGFGLRLAGAGNQIGLVQAEILSIGTALSSVGVRAEAGGTAFSRLFIEMRSAVADGGDALDDFGLVAGRTASQFARDFKTAPAEAVVAFVEGLDRLERQGVNTNDVLKRLGLDNIRTSDSLRRLAGAGDLLRRTLVLGNKSFAENIALANEAKKRYATLASQFKLLKNDVVDLSIDLGQQLTPAIRTVVGGARVMLDKFRELSPETKTLAAGVAAFGIVIGPTILVVGALVNVLGSFIGIVPKVVKGVFSMAKAFFTLDAALLPFSLSIAAITALVIANIAIWTVLFVNFGDKMVATFEKVKTTIVGTLKSLGASIKDFTVSAFDRFSTFSVRLNELLGTTDFFRPVVNMAKFVRNMVASEFIATKNFLVGTGQIVASTVTAEVDVTVATIKKLFAETVAGLIRTSKFASLTVAQLRIDLSKPTGSPGINTSFVDQFIAGAERAKVEGVDLQTFFAEHPITPTFDSSEFDRFIADLKTKIADIPDFSIDDLDFKVNTDALDEFIAKAGQVDDALKETRRELTQEEKDWERFAGSVRFAVDDFGRSLLEGQVNFKSFVAFILRELAATKLNPLFEAFSNFLVKLAGAAFGPPAAVSGDITGGTIGPVSNAPTAPDIPGGLTVIPDPVAPNFESLTDAITVLTDKLSAPSLLIAPSLSVDTTDVLAQVRDIGTPIVDAIDRLGQSPEASFDSLRGARSQPTTIVNVINKAPDSKVETKRRQLPGGGESFDVIISSVVSRDIAQGGQVAKTISAVFGSRRLGQVG